MRTNHFRRALLSTLLITSMIISAIFVISLLSVSTVSAQGPAVYENTIRAMDNAYTVNTSGGIGPWQWYDNNPATPYPSRPVLMAVATHWSGKVAVCSFLDACRDGKWNFDASLSPYLNYLLDATFKWLSGKSSDIKVLWYEGPTAPTPTGRVYNTMFTGGTSGTVQCGQLRDNLKNDPHFNYGTNLTYSTDSRITPSTLSGYDVVVLPQLELGSGTQGGDPSLLWDNELTALENYVHNGGGLLVFDGSDANGYNFCYVDQKILMAFDNMGMYIQHDSVQDDVNNDGVNYAPYVVVENTGLGSIGDKYKANNPNHTENLGLYSICSLAPKYPAQPTIAIVPSGPIFYEGIPGGKLVYELTITNAGLYNDNIILTKGDSAGWTLELAENRFDNVIPNESKTTELTVSIPTSATFGFVDDLTVQATSMTDATMHDNVKAKAIASPRVRPVADDAELNDNDPTRKIGGYRWLWVSSTNTPKIEYTQPEGNRRDWLKFDLRAIPSTIPPGNWDNNNIQVRLYAYCWGIAGAYGKNVQCYGVDYDNWSEATLCWDNQPGLPGTYLDTTRITEINSWYSWDVTSFVRSQLGKKPGDNFATLYIRAETENLAYPDNFAYEFYSKEVNVTEAGTENYYLPYLALGYDVNTWIAPDSGKAMLGGTAHFNVKVMNMGSFTDNYLLDNIGNTKNWTLTYLSKIENVKPNEIRSVDLGVGIPSGATIGDNDNVTIKVRSEKYPENAKDNDSCIVQASDNKISTIEDSAVMGQVQLENSVWGRSSTIWVGRRSYYAGAGFTYGTSPERGLLKFDLRGIPSIDNIVRANLNLYCYRVDNSGVNVQVRGVDDDSWLADNVTWLTKPSASNILDSSMVPAENMWYSWDVTDFVRTQYQTPGDNIASFCIIDVGENIDPTHIAYFESSNYGVENENENVRPYLEILSAAPENQVRVYIDPIFRGGLIGGSTENYTITVVNKGMQDDNYTLENVGENVDNFTWLLSLDNTSLFVPTGENRQTTLHVQIPSGSLGTIDNITVTATSQADNTVSDSARCFAYRGKANIPGFGIVVAGALYKVQVDVKFLVGSDLVVKFYDYFNIYESENVFWSGAIQTVENNLAVGHPPTGSLPVKKAVKKANLVLRSGASERVLASFTVRQSHLRTRYGAILKAWGANPPLQSAFRAEVGDILKQWSGAPT